MRRLVLCALVLSAGTLGGCGGDDPGPAPGAVAEARVARVVDGDTVLVRVGGAERRVRLLGVDAPESVTPDRPVECYGPQAGAAARALMPRGVRVGLATDPSQGDEDRFGRLLAEVTVAGEAVTVNERLVRQGAAEVFHGDGRGRLQPVLRAAEREARSARRGLWGACR